MPKSNSEAYPYILTNEEQSILLKAFLGSNVDLEISAEEADEKPLLLLNYELSGPTMKYSNLSMKEMLTLAFYKEPVDWLSRTFLLMWLRLVSCYHCMMFIRE